MTDCNGKHGPWVPYDSQMNDGDVYCETCGLDKQSYAYDLELENINYSTSIIKACEKVGKDSEGKFPFNAHDLAERILRVERENVELRKKLSLLQSDPRGFFN
jgi:hypothetical protein